MYLWKFFRTGQNFPFGLAFVEKLPVAWDPTGSMQRPIAQMFFPNQPVSELEVQLNKTGLRWFFRDAGVQFTIEILKCVWETMAVPVHYSSLFMAFFQISKRETTITIPWITTVCPSHRGFQR